MSCMRSAVPEVIRKFEIGITDINKCEVQNNRQDNERQGPADVDTDQEGRADRQIKRGNETKLHPCRAAYA